MGTNSYVTKLKAQIDRAITQRDHWKQLAENRNSIVVTEVCPESRSVEEYIIDADSVRASWRLIRGYREQIEALRLQNAMLATAAANIARERDQLRAEVEALRLAASVPAGCKVVPVELLQQIAVELEHDNDRYFLGRELRALLASTGQEVKP